MNIILFIKRILLWVWQLPQHLIALFMCAMLKVKPSRQDVMVHTYNFPSFSLGEYIFIHGFEWVDYCDSCLYGFQVLFHEVGHTRQSRYLGWLWLFVIGMPSALHWLWFQHYGHKHGYNYYNFYTEKWADKLGGVTRD